jgi:hypothetical protein
MNLPQDTAKHISAVVLGYKSGLGILLCQHRDSPSIEETLEAYMTNPIGKHWFAQFRMIAK